MSDQPAIPDADEIRARAQALHDIPVNPGNTLALRAEAWALLADLLISDYLHRWNDAGARELVQAEQAAENALKLSPKLALAHYANGFVQRAKGNHDKALVAFDEAIGCDPGFAAAYAQKANELISLGRAQEAPALVDKAIAMSPDHPSLGTFYWIRGRASFIAGNHADAVSWLAKSVAERPLDWFNRLYLVAAHTLAGDAASAATALADFRVRFPNYSIARVALNEHATPNTHPRVVAGRQRLHDALRKAGLPAT